MILLNLYLRMGSGGGRGLGKRCAVSRTWNKRKDQYTSSMESLLTVCFSEYMEHHCLSQTVGGSTAPSGAYDSTRDQRWCWLLGGSAGTEVPRAHEAPAEWWRNCGALRLRMGECRWLRKALVSSCQVEWVNDCWSWLAHGITFFPLKCNLPGLYARLQDRTSLVGRLTFLIISWS